MVDHFTLVNPPLYSEFFADLDLKTSGINNVNYPTSFPSPPTSTDDPAVGNKSAFGPSMQGDAEEEMSWFFYLSEISLRRTINSSLELLYYNGGQQWSRNQDQLRRTYMECEEQITLWYADSARC